MEVSALAGNGMERAVETDAAVAAGLRHDVSGAVVTQKGRKRERRWRFRRSPETEWSERFLTLSPKMIKTFTILHEKSENWRFTLIGNCVNIFTQTGALRFPRALNIHKNRR